jgi:G patch domain-containing protein 1
VHDCYENLAGALAKESDHVSHMQLKAQQLQSSTTSSNVLPDPESGEPDDDEAAKHLYAPRDTKVLVFKARDNSHGLGYTPGMGLSEIVDGSAKESSGPVISGEF